MVMYGNDRDAEGVKGVLKKQDGMTLVELLATLLLSSVIILLIWTTIAISMKYNVTETKKLQMQQEANYIITDIQRIHRNAVCYKIEQVNGTWMSIDCLSDKRISIYTNPNFNINLAGPSGPIYTKDKQSKDENGTYYPSYILTVTITDSDKKNLNIEIQTTISRFDERAE
nr:prepilin-type N-terminal cleavage/methylation domain-containing protein [Sporosarcina cyprini]